MERLTRKSDSMVWFIDREHKSGYAEREPCEMDAHHSRLAIEKLAEYEDIEGQGKLLKLPCAVGDTVYTNTAIQGWHLKKKDRPYEVKVVFIGINGVDNCMHVAYDNGCMSQFWFSEIGKTIFLTREEAEDALKQSKRGGEKEEMRLIEADKLMKELGECFYDTTNPEARRAAHDTMALCERLIREQPTAYDVDKVVEQLEELREMVPVNRLLDDIIKDKPKELGQLMAYRKAIEIVKSGGMS